MRVDSAAYRRSRDAVLDRECHEVDEFLGIYAVQGGAENAVRILIHQELRASLWLAKDLGARHDRDVRNVLHAYSQPVPVAVRVLLSFLFAHAHLGQRRFQERGGGDNAIVRRARAVAPSVAEDHAVIIEAHVRELRAASHIARGVHMLGGGAAVLVYHHSPAVVELHPSSLKVEAIRGGAPARGEQHGVCFNGAGGAVDAEFYRCGALAMNPADLRAGDHAEVAAPFEVAAHSLGDVPVIARQEGVAAVEHGDLGTELREHGGKLQPDGPAADHREALWPLGELLDRGGIHHRRVVDALNRWHDRHRAGVDDDGLAAHDHPILAPAHLHGAFAGEDGCTDEHGHAGVLGKLQVRGIELADERSAVLRCRGEGGVGIGGGISSLAGSGCLMESLSLHQQRLGGHAADVDARAAEHFGRPLNQDHAVAGLGAGHGDGLACLAKANDEHVGLELTDGCCLLGSLGLSIFIHLHVLVQRKRWRSIPRTCEVCCFRWLWGIFALWGSVGCYSGGTDQRLRKEAPVALEEVLPEFERVVDRTTTSGGPISAEEQAHSGAMLTDEAAGAPAEQGKRERGRARGKAGEAADTADTEAKVQVGRPWFGGQECCVHVRAIRDALAESGMTRTARSLSVPALIAVAVGNFLVGFDASAVNVVVTPMVQDFGGSHAALQWVLDGYTIPLCAFLFLSGALGDRFGSFRVYKLATALFLASSIACAVAPGLGWLIAARLVQGAAASFMLPMTLSIIAESESDATRRARAIGLWGVVGGVSIAAGPVLGGLMGLVWSWRAVFWLNLPICAAALLMLARHRSPANPQARRIPMLSQGLLLVFLFAVAWAMISTAHGGSASLVLGVAWGLAVAAAVGLVLADRKAQTPMVPEVLWRDRAFMRLVSSGAVYQFCSYGGLLVLTLWASEAWDGSAMQAGVRVLPCSVAWLCGNITVWLTRPQWRRGVIAFGTAVGAAGAFCTVLAGTHGWPLVVGMMAAGLASGLLASSLSVEAMSKAPEKAAGSASGLFNTSRQFGMVVAIATIGGMSVDPTIAIQFMVIGVGYLLIASLALPRHRPAGTWHCVVGECEGGEA